MSFFRSVIKKAAVSGSLLTGAGALGGTLVGFAEALDKKIPFPRDLHVMAKGGLFGAGKALQYTVALPVTYPLAKYLNSKGRTETFLQKRLGDLIKDPETEKAPETEKSPHPHVSKIPREDPYAYTRPRIS